MGSINNCKPTDEQCKVYIPNDCGNIGACFSIEIPQQNEDSSDVDINLLYVYDDNPLAPKKYLI